MTSAEVKQAWLDLAAKIYETGCAIFDEVTRTEASMGPQDPKVIALTLLARTLSNFDAALMLVVQGFGVEARTLARCCYENLFWIAALEKGGDAFVKHMTLDDIASRRKRAKGLLKWGAEQQEPPLFAAQLQAIVQDWEEKHPKAPLINLKSAAEDGAVANAYIFYSALSNDSAHPSASSLSRHISWSGEGDSATFAVHSKPIEVPLEPAETLEFACNALIGVCVGANSISGPTDAGKSLSDLSHQYVGLSNATKALDPE